MAAWKEPTGWVQGIASPRSLFLRRKVTSEPVSSAISTVQPASQEPCQRWQPSRDR
jgi:hypothetical protein